jgi:hypothetical protein
LSARVVEFETALLGLEKSIVIAIVLVESAQEENIRVTGLGRIIEEVNSVG